MNQPLDANAADLFQTGGSLAADAPTYVKRDADDELYAAIKKGEFCYVLNSRQMGKSSLRVQVMRRLQAEGVACAAIDLNLIGGQQVDADRWYAGLILNLARGFELTQQFNVRTWLREHAYLTPVQQLGEFIESVLLTQIAQPIVIFIDEIDSVISLDFSTDDLFTYIRACYNQRVDNSAYRRLTFVLLGVATPTDLIRDKTRTSFNVGKAIELSGFQFDQAQPLINALSQKLANPAEVLQRILIWTGGQPFLTQKLCRLVAEQGEAWVALSNESIDHLVQTQIVNNWEMRDDQAHLHTIQTRILQDESKAGRRLGIYQQILKQGAIPYDTSPEQLELRLSGVVVANRGRLEVYNQIYRSVFNEDWVNQALARLRPYADAISAWLSSEQQDESWLLQEQALLDAQVWALGKSLGTQDYEFLAASRELNFNTVLASQEEANQILEDANQKAARRLKLSACGVALAMSLAAIAGGLGLFTATEARKNAQQAQQDVVSANEELGRARKLTEATVENAKVAVRSFNKQLTATKTQLTLAQQEQERAEINAQVAQSQTKQAQTAAATAATAQNIAETRALEANLKAKHAENRIVDAEQKAAYALRQQTFANVGTRLEMAGADALNRFEFDFIDSFLRALRAGHELENLLIEANITQSKNFSAYPAMSPLLALQQIQSQLGSDHLLRHEGSSQIPSFSPDGTQVITIGSENTVQIWNLVSGKTTSLAGHQGGIYSAEFSPDGTQVVTASLDGTARIWDLKDSKYILIEDLQGDIYSASFSPDGSKVLTLSEIIDSSGSVEDSYSIAQIWHLQGSKATLFDDLKGSLFDSASFSPNGAQIVLVSRNGTAQKWDLQSGEATLFEGHQGEIYSATFSPDGSKILTLSDIINSSGSVEDAYSMAQIWDWDLQASKPTLFDEIQGAAFRSASFSPDGTQVLLESLNDINQIWNLQMWSLKSGKSSILEATQSIDISSVSFSPDGAHVLFISFEDGTRILDLQSNTSRPFAGYQDNIINASFSPSGRQILTTLSNGIVRIWELKGRGEFNVLENSEGYVPVSFNSDGTQILALLQNNSDYSAPRIWDLQSGKSILLEDHQVKIDGTSFSPDGSKILTLSSDGYMARIWDLTSGESMLLECHQDESFESASFSPDGNQVLLVSGDGLAQIWDFQSSKSTFLEGHQGEIYSASFSPDSSKILTLSKVRKASGDNTIAQISDLKRDESILLEGHQSEFFESASFSPNGTQVLIVSRHNAENYTTQLWNFDSGKSTFLERHQRIRSANFSPDGTMVLTLLEAGKVQVLNLINSESNLLDSYQYQIRGRPGRYFSDGFLDLRDPSFTASLSPDNDRIFTASSIDHTMRVVDLMGRPIAIYEGFSAVISPDTKKIVASGQDGLLRVYPVHTLPELLKWSCQRLHNYLEYGPVTDAERALCDLPSRNSNGIQPRFMPFLESAISLVQNPFNNPFFE